MAPPAPARPVLSDRPSQFLLLKREVEDEFRPQMLQVLQRKVNAVADSSQAVAPDCARCGRPMGCHDTRPVSWLARCGRLHVPVSRYRCPTCQQECRPLLDQLGVEPGRISGSLARILVLLAVQAVVLNSKEFQEAIRKHHGITDPSLVMVDIWGTGNYGSEEESGRRLARPLCFLRSDPTDNGYARPIEWIRPVVDLNLMQVIRVEEYRAWLIPPQPGNYAAARVPGQRKDIKPLSIT